MSGSKPAQQARLEQEREAKERRLVEAAQQDRARFVDIYEEYFEVVYAYAARRTGSRDQAEDLTAEVFRKALENLRRFKWMGAPFGAWLLRIAFNLIADRAKRATRERNVDGSSAANVSVSHSVQTQQLELEEAERRGRLFRLVGELPKDQRRVVVLRFAEEKSVREIADELRRTEGAVKQLQFRALENLRKKISPPSKQQK